MAESATPNVPLRIAVVGEGRAGRARVRDLGEHPETKLVAVVHRDDPLERVLEAPDVDAVAICTPNALHAEMVAAALAAGKHVLVEFPLAPGRERGAELFALARERGRVLHVEHIELLAPGQLELRRAAAELGRPLGSRGGGPGVLFCGGSEGWIGDAEQAGSPGLRSVARLHRLVDLFGEARVRDARLDVASSGYRLQVMLEFVAGGGVLLVEERARDLARRAVWNVPCEDGVLTDPPAVSARGVFRQDLDCFVDRVLRGASPYVSEERILHVLGLVDQIDAALV